MQARLPLDVLEDYVIQCFANVPNNGLSPDDFSSFKGVDSFNTPSFRRIYKIKPIKDVCEVRLRDFTKVEGSKIDTVSFAGRINMVHATSSRFVQKQTASICFLDFGIRRKGFFDQLLKEEDVVSRYYLRKWRKRLRAQFDVRVVQFVFDAD